MVIVVPILRTVPMPEAREQKEIEADAVASGWNLLVYLFRG